MVVMVSPFNGETRYQNSPLAGVPGAPVREVLAAVMGRVVVGAGAAILDGELVACGILPHEHRGCRTLRDIRARRQVSA
jgi:hypothetical protein